MSRVCERYHWTLDTVLDMTPAQIMAVTRDPGQAKSVPRIEGSGVKSIFNSAVKAAGKATCQKTR